MRIRLSLTLNVDRAQRYEPELRDTSLDASPDRPIGFRRQEDQ